MIHKLKACPTCCLQNSREVVCLSTKNKKRFFLFSKIKYKNFLHKIIENVQPVILECKYCGHFWYKFQPNITQLANMYAAGKKLQNRKDTSQQSLRYIQKELQILKKISNKQKITFLDYGSGSGRWSREAQSAGFEVTAYEPSKKRSAEAYESLNLVHSLNKIDKKKFDVINLNQVLEHTKNPFKVLKKIFLFCEKTTIVRITVPNILRCHEGSQIWDLWPFDGASVHSMAPFEHLHGFTPKSLNQLLKRAGFKPISLLLLLRFWPLHFIRNILGKFKPSLGVTARIVQIKNTKSDF